MRTGIPAIIIAHFAFTFLGLAILNLTSSISTASFCILIPLVFDAIYLTRSRHNQPSSLPWAEDHFDQILNAIDDLILVKGPKSRLLWANKAFCNYYGMTNDQLRGLIDAPFNEPDNTLQYVKDDTSVFESGRTLNIPQEPVTRHDGTVRLFHTVKSPIFDKNKKVIMTVGVSRDITDKVESEKQIQDERARALYSSKMATLGEMAGGIAHEINTPLTTAVLLAEQIQNMVKKGDLHPATIERHAERIIDIEKRISSIINGLRKFSREGSDDGVSANLFLHIIEDTLSFCRERFSINNVDLRIKVPEDLTLVCNPTKISQVLLNMFSNSLDAIKIRQDRWIEIKAYQTDESVDIYVTDSGPGIPEPIQSKMFLPFFTTKAMGQGTGLGLSISKSIIESHGGTLELQKGGSHTCFKIKLPMNHRL